MSFTIWCSSAARWPFRASSAWFDRVVIDGIVNPGGLRRRKAEPRATGEFDLDVIDGAVNGIAVPS